MEGASRGTKPCFFIHVSLGCSWYLCVAVIATGLQHIANRMPHITDKYQCFIKENQSNFPPIDSFETEYLLCFKKPHRRTNTSAYNLWDLFCADFDQRFISTHFVYPNTVWNLAQIGDE